MNIALRLANREDMKTLFSLRNAIEVRRYFFNPAKVSWDEHQKWFLNSLELASRQLLLAEIDSKVLGVFRFDLEGEFAEIDIYLAPEMMGKGLGINFLEVSIQWGKEHLSALKYIFAKVLKENRASRKMFEKFGFALRDETDTYFLYEFNLTERVL